MNKLYTYLFLILSVIVVGCSGSAKESSYSDPIEQSVDSLLSLMTLEEKIGQLNQYSVGAELTGPGEKSATESQRIEHLSSGKVGSVLNLLGASEARKMQEMVVNNSRLKIPLIFSFDVIHGYKTMFPIPLGESASWDLEAMKESARIAAREAAASGLQWTFAPMVDISRDARWGRVMEGAGEDPFLGSEIAKARIKGFQGNDLSNEYTIAACAKHFAGYGFVESGKDYNNVYIGENTLHNVIMPPFKASADAGAATFMNAFNDIDGVPSTANHKILKESLKGEWKFDGVVVSDWNSIGEMVNHGVARDKSEAAELAINAGSDIDMEGLAYISSLKELVESGKVEETTIDESVKRVLRLKYRLGLFDDPYKYFDEKREAEEVLKEEYLNTSEDIARKSIVLLKNEGNLLPLKESQKVGVIGPLAKDKDSPLGNWRGAVEANSAISFYEGMTNRFGSELPYAKGCDLSVGPNNFFQEVEINTTDKSGFKEAIDLAKKSEIVVMVLGETAYMSGEGRSRADIGLPGVQLDLLKEVQKVNKNIVLVLMNGRPLAISWESENIPAIVEAWHLGSRAGNAIADVLLGNYNPSGKLPMSFPRVSGQAPIYYNHKNTGRPSAAPGQVFYTHHMDYDNSPLYPFGYGLSYSTFEYGEISLSDTIVNENGQIIVDVDVTNKSDIDGTEVVQLYIQDEVASITRPVKELKGFKKVFIPANETVKVSFTISPEDLMFYSKNKKYEVEPGAFYAFVGTNSSQLSGKGFHYK